jgi:hypothetical protein
MSAARTFTGTLRNFSSVGITAPLVTAKGWELRLKLQKASDSPIGNPFQGIGVRLRTPDIM